MKSLTKYILAFLVLAAVFVWVEVAKSPVADEASANVHIYFLNVGQGDAGLILKGNQQVLIDGGPDDSVLSEVGKVMPVYDRKIETIILTHPHADHLVGLNQILDRYEVDHIYYSGTNHDSNAYKEFLDKAKQKNIRLSVPKISEEKVLFPDSKIIFLWPGDKYQNQTVENLNNTSEVVKFCYFSYCALFTGDIETDEQKMMIDYYSSRPSASEAEKSTSSQPTASNNIIFQSSILKLAHHGSTNGTNQLLLDAVKPKYGVLEVGLDNRYGHPHALVLDLLQKNNIQYSRTDRDRRIDFVLNKDGIIKK